MRSAPAAGRSASATIAAGRLDRADRVHHRMRDTVITSTPSRWSASTSARMSASSLRRRRHRRELKGDAGGERVGDQVRAVEQHHAADVAARGRPEARHERILAAGNGHSGRIALWYDCPTDGGHDERAADQEVRRRNSGAEPRAEAGAAEGDQARARARRSARERGIPGGEGAAAAGRVAHQHAAEARRRDRADQGRSHSARPRRLRLDARRHRRQRREDERFSW